MDNPTLRNGPDKQVPPKSGRDKRVPPKPAKSQFAPGRKDLSIFETNPPIPTKLRRIFHPPFGPRQRTTKVTSPFWPWSGWPPS